MPIQRRNHPLTSRGFTLVEILLVVFIIALAAAMVIPGIVQTMASSKLKSSVEMVRSLNTHARAMAVLQQKHMGIRYSDETGLIEIITMKSNSGRRELDSFTMELAGYRDQGIGDANLDIEAEEEERQRATHGVAAVMKKKLQRGIGITEFETHAGEIFDSSVHAVNYLPTGLVEGHTFILREKGSNDDRDAPTATVEIEHITGSFKVTYENL